MTLAVLFVVCTPLAWMLARGSLPFPRVWEAGVLCSLLLPPLVIGLLLVFMVGPYTTFGNLIGHFNLDRDQYLPGAGDRGGLRVSALLRRRRPGCLQRGEPATRAAGGPARDRPRRVFRRVTLPLAAPGLAMALAVAWARAMGAFGAVIIIAYHPYGLPLQIYTTLQQTGLASALPYALVLLVVALPLPLAAYIWSARAQGRRRG